MPPIGLERPRLKGPPVIDLNITPDHVQLPTTTGINKRWRGSTISTEVYNEEEVFDEGVPAESVQLYLVASTTRDVPVSEMKHHWSVLKCDFQDILDRIRRD